MRIPAVVLLALFGSAAMANAAENGDWHLIPPQDPLQHNYPFETGSAAIAESDAVYLRRIGGEDTSPPPGILERKIPLADWRGKRLRLALRLKSDAAATAFASIRKGNDVAINASLQVLNGGVWKPHQFVLDVPDNAIDLVVDLRLEGKGALWVEDVTLEAVGADVPVSRSTRVTLEPVVADNSLRPARDPGGPLPGDNGPITPPWISGDAATFAQSWAPPVMEAPH